MRHTLIPIPLRKSLRHDYRVRAGVVFLFMFSLTGLIGIVSLLPAFIHAVGEKNSAELALIPYKSAAKTATTTDSSKDIAKQTKALAVFNDTSKGKANYSTIIESIVSVRGAVKIVSIVTSRTASTTVTTAVQGIAPDRDELLAFKARLESATQGNAVDFPVSELAKSKDIQFSITVVNKSTP